MAYEFEAVALREVFPERRAECAGTLADRLEEHWTRAISRRWDVATAAPLALRIAQLRHLAFEETPGQSRKALEDGVINAYSRVSIDGAAQIGRRAPEDVFDPIQPLAAVN